VVSIIFILTFVIKKLSIICGEMRTVTFDISLIYSVNNSITNLTKKHGIILENKHTTGLLEWHNLQIRDIVYPDFVINQGDTVILNALNGRGKSTLINALLGLLKYNGSISFNGDEISAVKPRDYISYMPQTVKLFNRSIYENIMHGVEKTPEKNIELQSLISHFNINLGHLDRLAGKNGEFLSGGQRQIIYLLRMILQNKPIMILDEPTNSLDVEYKKVIQEMILSLNTHKTLIIVSHDSVFDKLKHNVLRF